MRILATTFAIVAVCGFATMAQAGTMASNAAAPTIDGADIAMLNTTGQTTTNNNDNTIWWNKSPLGQTFTSLGNTGGYDLTSITLRTSGVSGGTPSHLWTVRVGTITGGGTVFTQIASETASENAGDATLWTAGDYMTFTFATAVSLNPNTEYAFDWIVRDDGDGNPGGFFIPYNANTNYTGGSAYRSGPGTGASGDASLSLFDYDRVFHADLTAVPEPHSFCLISIALCGVGLVYRRRGHRQAAR